MPSDVKIEAKADADQARRELESLGNDARKLSDTFTTVRGQMALAMRGMAADAAIQLGQKFAGDIASAAIGIDNLDARIEQVFGTQGRDIIAGWAATIRPLTGQSITQIEADLANLVDKLNLDGQNPEDISLAQSLQEVAAAASLFSGGDYATFLEAVGNFAATGEAGILEDLAGAIEDTGSAAGNAALLQEAFAGQLEAVRGSAFTQERQINELGGQYQGLVDELGRQLAPILDNLPAAIGAVTLGIRLWGQAMGALKDHVEDVIDAMKRLFDLPNPFTVGRDIAQFGADALGFGGPSPPPGVTFDDLVGRGGAQGPAPLPEWLQDAATNNQRGGLVVNQNIGPGVDPAEAGRRVVEAIQAYERVNGAAPIGGG